jgi:hypothetical protein
MLRQNMRRRKKWLHPLLFLIPKLGRMILSNLYFKLNRQKNKSIVKFSMTNIKILMIKG